MFDQNDLQAVNSIRALSIDAIDKANSGHPGITMGAAPMAYVLWSQVMIHNPKNPNWFNRDRFVLSAGHGSMLLYSLLHLSGYDLTIEDLKNFRQWGSKTPGHPEFGHTAGVDCTTGPLGQGISTAVGMAMAEAHLAAVYNKEEHDIVNHYTYAICGDGDLMEGVSGEAASLAGHLKLGKLVVLYDSNDISLDGDLHMSFSENVAQRYESYGWQVIRVEDGNDLESIWDALEEAREDETRPTLIEVKTVIGYGSPNKAGKSAAHGSPLGAAENKLTREFWGWEHEAFHVPTEVYERFNEDVVEVGQDEEEYWNDLFASYKNLYPELAEQFERAVRGELPENWDAELPVYDAGKAVATRNSSGQILNAIAKTVPSLFGGSADLAGSNKTYLNGLGDFLPGNYEGRNIWFGVREFAMGTCLNGMALHGGLHVYGGTFFVFSDYIRPAVRLAALMGLPVTYVFTHDSIAVGEDGPTHEPIEHLASFRAMPNVSVIRPADSNETAAAWRLAMESQTTPTMLVLSRQDLMTLPVDNAVVQTGVEKGAYVVAGEAKDGIIIATGSEVALAVEAQKSLANEGITVSVISMPSWDRFEAQTAEYKESIFPRSVTKRLAVEVGSSLGWHKYVGSYGDVLSIDHFGASAPGDLLMEKFGFTVENVVNRFKNLK
ncbi:MAG: tkt [Bacillales bacterium]|jgi:transketolase|nr:tkt [Bacillales bacterium]